ncbi:MAG: MFS transporter [Actinophytocola sp.]|uniref:MFS transporter n=1 Tax=Actinophytocola sp. TaxID=1872138 RepID=UPI001327F022|nr:MFS transporter [Actinophytocola sp.]MPZ79982.1 MFS transporter [Actinophytocola sp.]
MARRWFILAAGIAAQATTSSFLYGMPFLIPELQRGVGVSLAEAGLLVSAPLSGLLLALIAWGAAADRYGERIVMAVGLAATGGLLLASLALPGLVAFGAGLMLAGAAGASVNAASGRVVLGWFTPSERGLAMGIRQTAQPIGVGLAAATLPPIAHRWGHEAAVTLPAVLCLVSAVLVLLVVIDPPRPAASSPGAVASPYRDEPARTLLRVHSASALLVVPQFVAATFAVTFLASERGWSPVAAGQLVAVVSVVGAVARVAAGVWSDRVGNRMGPMRVVALLGMLTMVLWGLGEALGSWLAVAALVAALIVTVSPNGLGFTATAELAGPFWAGRAMGVQNTGQNIVAMAAAPAFGALITVFGYPVALALAAVFPLAGAVLTPVAGERRLASARAA